MTEPKPSCSCWGCVQAREERAGRILQRAALISLGLAAIAAAVWLVLLASG